MAVDESESWRAVGARIAAARRAKGMSKRAAAREAGISEGWWRQLEQGYTQPAPGVVRLPNPRDETLEAVARAVEIQPAYLFGLVGRSYDGPTIELPEEDDRSQFNELRTMLDRLTARIRDVEQLLEDEVLPRLEAVQPGIFPHAQSGPRPAK